MGEPHTDVDERYRTTRKRFLQASGALLGGALGTAATSEEATAVDADDDAPNIVVVNCDDLGQRLESYGVSTMDTPTVRALADDGVRFENAFTAAPSCSSSRSALATGRVPHTNGMMGLAHPPHDWRMHEGERHTASYLKEAGYATHIFGKLHLAREGQPALDEQTARELGFDDYHRAADRTARALGDTVEQFLQNPPAEPFYLEINFHQPHRISDYPYFPFTGPDVSASDAPVTVPDYLPDNEATRTELADFRAAVAEVDDAVNRIFSQQGCGGALGENTLTVFTADQGISMPRAKPTLFEPSIEIPLIAHWPAGGLTGGEVVLDLVSNVDVLPTLLDAVGAEVPDEVQGQSLLATQRTDETFERDAVFSEKTSHTVYLPVRTVRTDRYKLIRRFGKILMFQTEETKYSRTFTADPRHFVDSVETLVPPAVALYDLEADPTEEVNLAEDEAHADVLADLDARLATWMAETGDPLLDGPIETPYGRASRAELQRALPSQ